MTTKTEDQFLRDYFPEYEEISVNCRWLQRKLMELNRIKRENKILCDRNSHLKNALLAKDEIIELDCPKYRLDVMV